MKRRFGLTLVEMLVALAAASIVILATAIVLVFGQRSYNRSWQQANLQRDAAYTMLRIKQSIRNATSAQLDADELGIKIFRPTGWIRFRYEPGQNDLRYQLEDEEERTLLDGKVSDVTFEIDASSHKTVTVGLELTQGNCTAKMTSTTLMRNFGS
ncbi:MAG: prepilin-type N-terminal cleavage/methylation domain-containing protein [Sedimentisphaerales bacterium]